MHTRTTPLPPVDLADPIWTVEHVALAFRIGIRAARTLIARPDFPAAFRLSEGRTARLYWRRERVLDFVDTTATATPEQTTPAPVAPRRAATVGEPAPATAAAAPDLPRYAGTDDDALAAIAALRAAQAVAS